MFIITESEHSSLKTGLNNIDSANSRFLQSNVRSFSYNSSMKPWIRVIITSTPYDHQSEYSISNNISNNIILGEKYYLNDIKTIKKFRISITPDYINLICSTGNIRILEYLLNTHRMFEYNERVLNLASRYGHIDVLEWWLKSNLQLKYNQYALEWASYNGHVKVLDWWLKSNLPLKYDEWALNLASREGHIDVLEWWKNSGQELKYTNDTLDYASRWSCIKVLEWWKNSGRELKYTEDALAQASYNGHIDVLEWWLKSKLKLKYNGILNYKGVFLKKAVIDWWVKSKLLFKYDINALNYVSSSRYGNINELEWWKNWKNAGLFLEYDVGLLEKASYVGRIDLLEWWLASKRSTIKIY
jgi:hypothetical protein